MKQTTQATEIKKKIEDLVTGRTRVEHIFFYEGTYKQIEGDQLTEITPEQATGYMLAGSRLYYVSQDLRKWNDQQGAFVGQEAQHPHLPEVPEGADVLKVHTTFPPENYARTFLFHRKHEQKTETAG